MAGFANRGCATHILFDGPQQNLALGGCHRLTAASGRPVGAPPRGIVPKSFKLHITVANKLEMLPVEFPDGEWATLSGFLDEAQRLEQTALLRGGVPLQLRINGDVGRPIAIAATVPPDDLVAAFLYRMRPFLLKKKEPYNFEKVCGLVGRRIRHPHVGRVLKRLRRGFALEEPSIEITVGSHRLHSPTFLNTWLYAEEYHRDADKRALLGQVSSVFSPDATRVILLSSLRRKALCVLSLANLIHSFANHGRTLTMHMDP